MSMHVIIVQGDPDYEVERSSAYPKPDIGFWEVE